MTKRLIRNDRKTNYKLFKLNKILPKDIMENILEPRLIGELTLSKNNYQFLIPSYQRGYRWGKEEVSALLDDLLEFLLINTDRKERYCLQPIVVKQLENGYYEVLDGQQRLTTLYILLSYLKEDDSEINLFGLEYETRPNSAVFLQNLTTDSNEENPDYFYISKAYTIIVNWFNEKSISITRLKRKFSDIIFEQLEIIWYEIKDQSNPIDVFTRINIGKIPLTNSELVKAVFLSKNNLQIGLEESERAIAEAILNNKQSVIAFEWDAMEKQLQNHEFWSFIFNKKENNYKTRIDYILDLVTESTINKKDNLESFNKYYNQIKETRADKEQIDRLIKSNTSLIEVEWASLKSYFDILLEWYNDKWYNHIIGYLISRGEDLLLLLNSFKNLNREGFKENLIEKVKVIILSKDISELNYEVKSDKKTIENILILHNVIGSLIQPDTSVHFPFKKINLSKWSLEHIYAQNSDELLEKDYPLWVADHLKYFKTIDNGTDTEVPKFIVSLEKLHTNSLAEKKDEYKDLFNKTFSKIDDYIRKKSNDNGASLEDDLSEYNWVTKEHSIANLTLLDVSANSHLSNSLFAVKREKIKKLDRVSAYIPNETRKVFLKYYSSTGNHDAYWTYDDRIAYIQDIQSKISQLENLLKLK